jgi:uncharacterized phage protein (TIGR02218 family)
MTFDSREKSTYQGQPVEGYKFAQGDNIWKYTSADESFTLPSGLYEPAVISRSEMSFSEEDTGETLEISVARDNPIAELFIAELPSNPIWVTIFRAHRGDEDLAVTIFAGKVIRAKFEESEAILTAGSLITVLSRAIPPLTMQTQCNHYLYSPECGVDSSTHRDQITVTGISGSQVTAAEFALKADDYFRGGRLVTPEGDQRFIAAHTGDTVTLLSPLPGLAIGMICWAYYGCDHTESTCATKFSNLDQHLGWARIPSRNCFEGRID